MSIEQVLAWFVVGALCVGMGIMSAKIQHNQWKKEMEYRRKREEAARK